MSADTLPDAEAALDTLVERMRRTVRDDAALVGIYSGGAWLAERLAQRLPGSHPLGFIDVSYYRDDYALSGLKANTRRTSLPFDVGGATIVLVDRGGRELPIEASYKGTQVSMPPDRSIVLSRNDAGTFALGVGPARARERAEPRAR
jgi:pyrimidine operon attenuation protein/uracil phosphoribosyltransferase